MIDLSPFIDTSLVLIVVGLGVLISIAIVSLETAERRHRELIRLLNDLATMLGEMFDKKE